MSLLSCLKCATLFAVGLLHCPHCLSEDFEEADVPKITYAGPSHPEDHSPDGPPAQEAPAAPVEPEAAVPAAEVAPEPEPAPEPDPEPAAKPKAAPSLSSPKAADG